jgi:hypothetical protein
MCGEFLFLNGTSGAGHPKIRRSFVKEGQKDVRWFIDSTDETIDRELA